jgi:hypothetical protein
MSISNDCSIRLFINKVEDLILNERYLTEEGFVRNQPKSLWENIEKGIQIADELVCQLPFDIFFVKVDHIINGTN